MIKNTKKPLLLMSALGLSLALSGCGEAKITAQLDGDALNYLEEKEATDVSTIVDTLVSLQVGSKQDGALKDEEHLSLDEVRSDYATGKRDGELTPYKITTLASSEVPKLRRLYSDTIIIGNSRAKSILDSGILTSNEVLYKWAAHVDEVMDIVQQGAGLHRRNALFIFGVNDLGYYTSNTARFKRDYVALIHAYREINPNGEIYLQEIIPINENFRFRWYNMDRVTDYNAVIREICEEEGCTYVSSVYYAIPEFLTDDGTGAHYNYQYHIYWAQTMANQMGLWEEQE